MSQHQAGPGGGRLWPYLIGLLAASACLLTGLLKLTAGSGLVGLYWCSLGGVLLLSLQHLSDS